MGTILDANGGITGAAEAGLNPEQYGQEALVELVYRLISENERLAAQLTQSFATINRKDELILEWIASARGWKAVCTALREEGQSAPDRAQHHLAHNPAERQQIYRRVRQAARSQLQAQLYPPTSWRPR